jgi:hypothetical protein
VTVIRGVRIGEFVKICYMQESYTRIRVIASGPGRLPIAPPAMPFDRFTSPRRERLTRTCKSSHGRLRARKDCSAPAAASIRQQVS